MTPGRDGERPGLDPVRHHVVVGAAQPALALDLDRVRGGAPHVGAHLLQEGDQVVDLGLLGRGPDDVWPSARVAASIAFSVPMTDTNGNRTSVPAQPAGRLGVVVAVPVVDRGAHGPHRVDVEVHRPPPDPIAAGVADDHLAEARQERPEEHEAGAHLGRGLERHEQPVDVARGHLVGVRRGMVDHDAEVGERLGHRPHVLDLGHVAEPAALAGQGRGGEHLERGVLGAADADRALERRAAGHEVALAAPRRAPRTPSGTASAMGR